MCALVFSQPEVPLSRSVYFRKVPLFCLLYPPLSASTPIRPVRGGGGSRDGKRAVGAWCLDKRTTRTGYRGLQPVGVSVWLRCSSHTNTHPCARTYVYTQSWECSCWRAKSPFLLHIHSLLSLHSPFPPSHLLPFSFSFIPSFLLLWQSPSSFCKEKKRKC